MKHLGDITKISGYEVPLVDCVIGGSPCQNFSIAGQRFGLSGDQSGLFMEQIRIIREMRNNEETDRGAGQFVRPRYMVWENVPGAFSSNGGEDFRTVLEETARIADENVTIPGSPKSKWGGAGVILADGWSIAWRTLDAQYWGVPQRRRRIALVADFGGQSAPEILFERKSVPGNVEQAREAKEPSAIRTKDNLEASGLCLDNAPLVIATSQTNAEILRDKAPTIIAGHEQPIVVQPTEQTMRRLTPLECERLQGFPDGWTDIGEWIDNKGKVRKTVDSARYKALGNSIAIPPWTFVLKRLCQYLERPATMASLFDGIGGFPLIWERINGKGTCLWSSEIEEFPIAVSKYHFG